jgi:transcriptional regulator GlxA family with amidase domain
MSRRTFTRHFRQTTGTTVIQWLLSQRLAYAQRMLETDDSAIEIIALEAGFGSAVSLRQHFGAAFNTSPSAYRKQFRGAAA